MDAEWVQACVGRIVTNLQSLEFVLRLFLSESVGRVDASIHIDRLKVGDVVTESHLTNYDSLREVIRKANARLQELGLAERVDESAVATRDGPAHGRVFTTDLDKPFRLIKFDRLQNGQVPVAMVIDLNEDWLKNEVARTGGEILKVVKLGQQLGLACFPDDVHGAAAI
jgi:hypothetical protein